MLRDIFVHLVKKIGQLFTQNIWSHYWTSQKTAIYLAEKVNVDAPGPDVFQVSLGVVLEVVGHGHPDGLLAALQEVFVDEAGDGAAFADAGAVTCWRKEQS